MSGRAPAGSLTPPAPGGFQERIDAWAQERPDLVLMAPFMTYLVLMLAKDAVPVEFQPAAILLRAIGAFAVVWLLRRHFPPWGRPHWLAAVAVALFCGWGWMAGQYLADEYGLGGRLPGMPGKKELIDPRSYLGAGDLFWATWSARLIVACTAVPVVEELFWRAFLLRAMADWSRFDKYPLGYCTLFSFLGTSLLSTVQHPDNWLVSIPCWFAFNALFIWTRSIWCLVICHGVTNLVLYLMALRIDDWSFF